MLVEEHAGQGHATALDSPFHGSLAFLPAPLFLPSWAKRTGLNLKQGLVAVVAQVADGALADAKVGEVTLVVVAHIRHAIVLLVVSLGALGRRA